MAFDLTVIGSHVTAMQGNLPVTTSIGTGYRMMLTADRRMELYGTGTNYSFSVRFVASAITVPSIGDKMTVDSVEFRVSGLEYDPARVGVRVDLEEKYS